MAACSPSSFEFAQHLLNGRDQLLRLDRLGQMFVEAAFERAFAVAFHGITGERDDRDVLEARELAKLMHKLITIQIRQADIGDHDIRLDFHG